MVMPNSGIVVDFNGVGDVGDSVAESDGVTAVGVIVTRVERSFVFSVGCITVS